MIRLYVILLFSLSSCGYQDIDTVPNFDNVNITEEESIDLCKISNSDSELVEKCIEEIYQSNN